MVTLRFLVSMLGNIFEVAMSMQSMSESVLANIKRSNIKLDHMVEINKELNKQGRTTGAELIVPLPGETKESFIEGLNTKEFLLEDIQCYLIELVFLLLLL